MSGALRLLGVLVLVAGVAGGGVAGALFLGDAHYAEVAAAYERHPTHALFQAEYWAASARHWALLAAAVGGALIGLVWGGLLLGMATLLTRTRR
ncbi:MAG: hypothetical protein KIT14_16925 [bacterium]|nr:hypothetical protein [bacterium]